MPHQSSNRHLTHPPRNRQNHQVRLPRLWWALPFPEGEGDEDDSVFVDRCTDRGCTNRGRHVSHERGDSNPDDSYFDGFDENSNAYFINFDNQSGSFSEPGESSWVDKRQVLIEAAREQLGFAIRPAVSGRDGHEHGHESSEGETAVSSDAGSEDNYGPPSGSSHNRGSRGMYGGGERGGHGAYGAYGAYGGSGGREGHGGHGGGRRGGRRER